MRPRLNLLQNKSRCKRLQTRWLESVASRISTGDKVLDLGGVSGAAYHTPLRLKAADVVIWNFSPEARPDLCIDLDAPASFPPFPADRRVALAVNLLEHLYNPLALMEWVCRGLPPGGCFIITTPFCYPFHPSPLDFWRFSIQTYERFFAELAAQHGVQGMTSISALGEDLRDIVAPATTPLYFGPPAAQVAGMTLEAAAGAVSGLARLCGAGKALSELAWRNAPAIGVVWTKSP